MEKSKSLFFCAIGGSGMMPLALIMKARGYDVSGSDRARDQGRTPERFAFLEKQGLRLFPQDGSGVSAQTAQIIVSTAVEKEVPDYQAALKKKIPIVHRAALLASIANEADVSIGIAGTSGKSTTTAMIGWILNKAKRKPTVINGAGMKNFISPAIPFASSVVGDPDLVVTEIDESDGSIDLFSPRIAVLNNISTDHKTMKELRALFRSFTRKAKHSVINLDNVEAALMAKKIAPTKKTTFSLSSANASLSASSIKLKPDSSAFDVTCKRLKQTARVSLPVAGEHNIANALAAIGATLAAGVDFKEACRALASFKGIARRLDVLGSQGGITVIDDFAHNPDKINATLKTLRKFEGRLLVLFQPHGYGPLRLMKDELAASFAQGLQASDALFLCDPLYLGGTTNKEVTNRDLAEAIAKKGGSAIHLPTREECAVAMIQMAQSGDRIVIMGARDDSLTAFAQEILFHAGAKAKR